MTLEEQIQYWLTSAEHDLAAAESLFQNGYYVWCLFLGHLVLEKTLKAFYVRDLKKTPLRTHDLLILAESISLPLTGEQKKFIFTVNDFHLEARYPEVKMSFYKLCTKEFAQENFNKIKEFYRWLKSRIT